MPKVAFLSLAAFVMVSTTAAGQAAGPGAMPGYSPKSYGENSWLPICASIAVVFLGAVAIGLLGFLQFKDKLATAIFFKMFSLTLVLVTGLILIVAGYTQDQIAGMMGLLGSVVGYILGRGDTKERPAAAVGGSSRPATTPGQPS